MKVIQYIQKKIDDNDLKSFILDCYKSSEIRHQLYALCILIEIKFELLPIEHFNDVVKSILSKGLALNFQNFTKERANTYSSESKIDKPIYSRVVTKDTFNGYIGDFKFNEPYIDFEKIKINGWSTRNGTVWITLKDELNNVINNSIDNIYKANDVCDFLGLPREYEDVEYFKINYSSNFNECVFQPNSSNVLWHYNYVLFLAYKKDDGFGRTYNENGFRFGREQVHSKSYYFDNEFNAEIIGLISEKYPINDNIINEAKKRLEI
ncbi:hypothetical protein VB264_10600 [Arcicella aquatica]|uniref:Uncharacterized protein n=1 Tax=Arcicella aquatica TaxID=217141 RepID=A0ABU5QNI5_9BACT|nr:hypothetical protein [Arcicella aquatica]MEA5258229.1 hypothetical protein [Arcicella aquatica]